MRNHHNLITVKTKYGKINLVLPFLNSEENHYVQKTVKGYYNLDTLEFTFGANCYVFKVSEIVWVKIRRINSLSAVIRSAIVFLTGITNI